MNSDELQTMQNTMSLRSFQDVAEADIGHFPNIPGRFRMTAEIRPMTRWRKERVTKSPSARRLLWKLRW